MGRSKAGGRSILVQDKLWAAIQAQADALGLSPEAYVSSVMVDDINARAVKAAKLARLQRPPPAPRARPTVWAHTQPPPRDVKDEDLPSGVQRSSTPSGFVGVYAQGQRWRAMHRGRLLGVFDTAPEAALARYEEIQVIAKARADEYDALQAQFASEGLIEYGPVAPPKPLPAARATPNVKTPKLPPATPAPKTGPMEPVEPPKPATKPLAIFSASSAPVGPATTSALASKPVTAWEDAKERRRQIYRQQLIEDGMLDEDGKPYPDMVQYITEPY